MLTVEERLLRLEDRIAIYQLVCGYGYAADGCNTDALGEIYADDGVYAIGDVGAYRGRAEVQDIVRKGDHLALVAGGVAHMSSLPFVVVDGDRAVATCHTMIARHTDDGFAIWRLSASRIECARNADGRWEIRHRQNHLLDGAKDGPALLGRLLEGPALDNGV